MTSISATTREESFLSPHDGRCQTFLLEDFQRAPRTLIFATRDWTG